MIRKRNSNEYVLTDLVEYKVKKKLDSNQSVKMNKFYEVRCERTNDHVDVKIVRGATPSNMISVRWTGDIENGTLKLEKKKTFSQTVMFLIILLNSLLCNFTVIYGIVGIIKGLISGREIFSGWQVMIIILIELFACAGIVWYQRHFYKKPREILESYFEEYIL